MRIDVLTTFPEMFDPDPPAALGVSIPGRARAANIVEVIATNIRDFTNDPHHKTDDRPFGGGPGMVMLCQPIWDAVQHAEAADPRPARRILMSPQGKRLDQAIVNELATADRLLILAGHYEGIDQRVIDRLEPLEISIGDFVISGGELAAMVLIDAITRQLPGAIGHSQSAARDSFSPLDTTDAIGEPIPKKQLQALGLPENATLLDCPHYTRPREWNGTPVPEVLLTGDHQAIAKWRLQQMLDQTKLRRPDLLNALKRE